MHNGHISRCLTPRCSALASLAAELDVVRLLKSGVRLSSIPPTLACMALLVVACQKRPSISRPSGVARAALELRAVTIPTLKGPPPGAIAATDSFGQPLLLAAEVLVATPDVQEVRLSENRGNPVITLMLSAAAGERLARATQVAFGGQLAIVVDGRVVSTPRIQGPLGRQIARETPQSQQEALALAQRLAP